MSRALNPELTIQQVLTEMKATQQKQNQIDQELTALLEGRRLLEEKIDAGLRPSNSSQLRLIREESQRLAEKVRESSLSATALSSKVREVDLSQSRVREALSRVEIVLDVKNTINSVEKAIAEKDYESAAKNTYRCLHQQKPVQNDVSFEVLLELERKTKHLVRAETEDAERFEDFTRIARYARLFPLLGDPFGGLSKYCQVVRRTLYNALTKKGLTLRSQPAGAVVAFPELVTAILDAITNAVRQNAKNIQLYFGTGTHVRLIQELQLECDDQVGPLLRQFIQERRLVSLVHESASKAKPFAPGASVSGSRVLSSAASPLSAAAAAAAAATSAATSAPASSLGAISEDTRAHLAEHVRHIDELLEEIAYLIREGEIFDLTMRQVVKKALAALRTAADKEEKSDKSKRHVAILTAMKADSGCELAHVTALNQGIQELIGLYLGLEEYVMIHNVEKAMRIDRHEQAVDAPPDSGGYDSEGKARPARRLGGTGGASSGTGSHAHSHAGANPPSSTHSRGLSVANMTLPLNLRGRVGGAPAAAAPQFEGVDARFALSHTSSMVDEVFFNVKRCTLRAFSSCNPAGVCAIVNHVNIVLRSQFKDALERTFTYYASQYASANNSNTTIAGRFFAQLPARASAEKKLEDDAAMLLALNNLDASTHNVLMLKQQLESEYDKNFTHREGSTVIKQALSDLHDTSGALKAVIKDKGIPCVIDALLPTLKPVVDLFISADYQMSESDYADREVNDVFIPSLIDVLSNELGPLKRALTEPNYVHVLRSVLTYITEKRLEIHAMQKRFTFWGGLQFDKDVRKLSQFFSGLSSHTFRDRFARLSQIAQILQMEKPSEVIDYWSATTELSRLSEREVKNVLKLRVEFAEAEIAQLRLAA